MYTGKYLDILIIMINLISDVFFHNNTFIFLYLYYNRPNVPNEPISLVFSKKVHLTISTLFPEFSPRISLLPEILKADS